MTLDMVARLALFSSSLNTNTEDKMVAYLHKAPKNTWKLTIGPAPRNGQEFTSGEHIQVAGKREANAICKVRGVKPWNF